MDVRTYLITDVIVSIADSRLRQTTETLERHAGRNATWALLRMVGPRSPPDVAGLRHFCQDYVNNTK